MEIEDTMNEVLVELRLIRIALEKKYKPRIKNNTNYIDHVKSKILKYIYRSGVQWHKVSDLRKNQKEFASVSANYQAISELIDMGALLLDIRSNGRGRPAHWVALKEG